MSVKVSTAVWHDERFSGLKGNTMLAMLALADVAGDDGSVIFAKGAKRSQEALAKKARMSVATFRRATQELAELGLLEVTRESQRTENEYRVIVTAQSERSGVSGQDVESERSERSPVSGHSSIDVLNVTTDVGAAPKRVLPSGTRIPQPFIVTPAMVAWAREHAPLVDGPRSTVRFENYWIAKTGKDATKRDWERTWQNWLLKDQEDAERRPGAKASPTDRALATIALGRDPQKAVG